MATLIILAVILGIVLAGQTRLVAQNLQHGYDKNVLFNGTGINIYQYDHKDKTDLVDVTNTGTAGLQALLATIKRDECSFALFFDAAAAPVAMGIVSGSFATLTFITGASPITIPVRISEVGTKSAVADAVRVDVSAKYSVF